MGDSFAAFLQLPRIKATSERSQATGSGPQLRRYYDREHRRQAQQYSELLMLHREAGTRPARYASDFFTLPLSTRLLVWARVQGRHQISVLFWHRVYEPQKAEPTQIIC